MDNRQLIMEKALELFCARGYDAVGVQEIGEIDNSSEKLFLFFVY